MSSKLTSIKRLLGIRPSKLAERKILCIGGNEESILKIFYKWYSHEHDTQPTVTKVELQFAQPFHNEYLIYYTEEE